MNIKIVEWFGGVGAASQSLKKIYGKENVQIVDYVEMDKHAVNAFNAINDTDFKPTDINNVDVNGYGEIDIVVAGWPCLTKDTLVTTKNGLKEIKNIIAGDVVKTHTGEWKKVEDSWETGIKQIWNIKSQLNNNRTTDNHKWFVLRDNKHQWVRTDELTTKDKMIHQINNVSKDVLDLTGEQLFILGVYAGDGNIIRDGSNKAINGISLTVSNKQVSEILNAYPSAKVYAKSNTNKAVRIDIRNRELAKKAIKFVKEYSHLKEVHRDIIDLPIERLRLFFNGYMLADGTKDKHRNRYSFTTVSKKLAITMQEIALKLYKVPVNWIERQKHKSLGKRIKYQLDFTFPNKLNNLNKYFYANIKSIENTKQKESVWDINVEKDHSFYANNIITHNCQDYSIAGKGLGLDGQRSSLILLTISKLKEMKIKPKYILLENVKGLLSIKHKQDLDYIKQLFNELGYKWDQVMLNAKHFDIPQSRERVYMLLTRNDLEQKIINDLSERKIVTTQLKDILDFTTPTQTMEIKTLLESDYGKGVKREYENYIYLPPTNPEKPLNNLEGRRLWKTDKYVGTIPAGQRPKVYFHNKMKQYNNKVIELDLNKLANQKQGEINKVATLGEFNFDKEYKTNNFGSKDRFYGINGINGTITASEANRMKVIIEEHSFKQKKNYLGMHGVAKTLRAGECEQKHDSINRVATLGELETLDRFKTIKYVQSSRGIGIDGAHPTIAARSPRDMGYIVFKNIKFKQDETLQGINGQASTMVAQAPHFKGKIIYNDFTTIHYRSLSVRECWRLMGFSDDNYDKVSKLTYFTKGGKEKRLISDSQMAKQAGNSIVVNVLDAIFKKVFEKGEK